MFFYSICIFDQINEASEHELKHLNSCEVFWGGAVFEIFLNWKCFSSDFYNRSTSYRHYLNNFSYYNSNIKIHFNLGDVMSQYRTFFA